MPLIWAGFYERRAGLNAVMAVRVWLQPRLLQLNGAMLAFTAGFFLMGGMPRP